MNDAPMFEGFPEKGLRFLSGLGRNNNKDWFEGRKDVYREQVIAPAQAFVISLGRRLQKISSGIIYDTRLNGSGSLMRIHRDVRFSKDKSPYRDWIGVYFWEGRGKKLENPGFFMRIHSKGAFVGAGYYVIPKPVLAAFRDAVADPKHGAKLDRALTAVNKSRGLTIGGEHYKRVPRGYDDAHPRADLLRHNGLYAYTDTIARKHLTTPEFVDICYDWCRKIAPLHRWLVELTKSAK
jgi:uncharacterized protein (TIGR02453 family)